VELIGWLLSFLPRSAQVSLGRSLGHLLAWRKIRLGVVQQNLQIAFPDKDENFRRQLIRQSYEGLGNLVIEILLIFGPFRSFIEKHSSITGTEHWRAAKKLGKGVIFASSHVGNWEIMAATGAVHDGMDMMIVTKHLKPEWIHRAVERARLRCGVRATYEPKTLKDVLRHLGKNGTVGFVMDQYSGPPVGVRVPVFGVPVGTPAAIAMLAKRTGATVLPVVNWRDEKGRFRVEIRAPLPWATDPDTTREIALNTARFATDLEKDILAHPEQWLWIHRRFKGDLGPIREQEWSDGRSRR
jgi:KDO2-lipid IV(A) lauroyltransferase